MNQEKAETILGSNGKWGLEKQGRRKLWSTLEVLLDELAEAFVVFLCHVDELNAAAVGPNVADDGGEVNFAEAGPDFELDGIADA